MFTQRHFIHMAEEVVSSTKPRGEKLAIVQFLVVAFSADSERFKADLFIRKCGFKKEDILS